MHIEHPHETARLLAEAERLEREAAHRQARQQVRTDAAGHLQRIMDVVRRSKNFGQGSPDEIESLYYLRGFVEFTVADLARVLEQPQ